jgi:tRNA dimethylallyltransferase
MAAITTRGKVPLLVGGTMLYFKALVEGLVDLPPADPPTRAEIDRQAAARGWPALHAELATIDPVTAARLPNTDSQRIQRALEVFRVSGRPLSALIAAGARPAPAYAFLSLGLLPSERRVLHQRIAERFDAMLAAGLEVEVEMLRRKYALRAEMPSMRCVGYRQVWEVQQGLAPRHELRDRGIYATRQLAKRQITWLGNSLRPQTFDCLAADLPRIMPSNGIAYCGAYHGSLPMTTSNARTVIANDETKIDRVPTPNPQPPTSRRFCRTMTSRPASMIITPAISATQSNCAFSKSTLSTTPMSNN